MWNCTHFRHPTDEQLRHVDIYFLATTIICRLSTFNGYNLRHKFSESDLAKQQQRLRTIRGGIKVLLGHTVVHVWLDS